MEKISAKKTKPNPKNPRSVERSSATQSEFREDRLFLKFDQINSNEESGILHARENYLALKNENTYLIASELDRLKLVLNYREVYSDDLPPHKPLFSVIYIEHLDCFFLSLLGNLYRKDIDDKPPYIFLELSEPFFALRHLRYSKMNRSLVSFFLQRGITIVDLDIKKVEIIAENDLGGIVVDCKLFGEKENMLVSISEETDLGLHILDFRRRKILSSNRYKIQETEKRSSLGVSDQNDYVLVGVSENNPKLIVFKVEDKRLVKKALLFNRYSLERTRNTGFGCCGYFGSHILWVGFEEWGLARARVYDYDTKMMKLRELKSKSVPIGQSNPTDLYCIGNRFYFTGERGSFMRLTVNY